MTLSILGVGALLALGRAFHRVEVDRRSLPVYLGEALAGRRQARRTAAAPPAVAPVRMLAHAWLVTTLNPKSIVSSSPSCRSSSMHAGCSGRRWRASSALAFANAFGYAILASRARRFASSPRALRTVKSGGRHGAERLAVQQRVAERTWPGRSRDTEKEGGDMDDRGHRRLLRERSRLAYPRRPLATDAASDRHPAPDLGLVELGRRARQHDPPRSITAIRLASSTAKSKNCSTSTIAICP